MSDRTCLVDGCERAGKLRRGMCGMHYQRWAKRGTVQPSQRPTVEERFWNRVARTSDDAGCWEWTGPRLATGYGSFRPSTAHRFAYELLVGPIPDGFEVDHLCRNRACVNPAHLEATTHAENVRRATRLVTHCPHGHEYDEANTYVRSNGHRQCRACARALSRKAAERARRLTSTK